MREKLLDFVLEGEFGLFDTGKGFSKKNDMIYQTKDARAVHFKVLSRLSRDFVFNDTSKIWDYFGMNVSSGEILRRQEFFQSIASSQLSGTVLDKLNKPRCTWKPRYDVVVVTEDEASFVKLNELNCGVVLLSSQNDVADLERYDVVQVVNCEDFRGILERLPQSVFLDSVEDVYLERFLEELSGWRENFALLNGSEVSKSLRETLDLLIEPLALLENKEGKIISEGEVEGALEDINEEISEAVKGMIISGDVLMKMLSDGKMSEEVLIVVQEAIRRSGIPEHVFNIGIPVSIDYKELESQIRLASANEFSDLSLRIARNAKKLKSIPEVLRRLEAELLLEDFCYGVTRGFSGLENLKVPEIGEELLMEDGVNLFLKDAQPVSFVLGGEDLCSILTGANSGGKTTLLEHLIQNISLMRIGLLVSGRFVCPVFDEVYYFAKTKGSASKGAFETLLTQLSSIALSDGRGQKRVLILADEIEAVTEPGVAGRIIAASAEWFVKRGCFVVLATHLGLEITKNLPSGARVDGIEATGLDENFNLIVNHNPVLGRLASSTPELIVERMALGEASSGKFETGSGYLEFLFNHIKK